MAKTVDTSVYTTDDTMTISTNVTTPIKFSKTIGELVNVSLMQDVPMDTSNVYTTINPDENEIHHLCTSITRIETKKDSEGNVMVSRMFNPDELNKVNLRMAIMYTDSANYSPFRWSGISDYTYPGTYNYNGITADPNKNGMLMTARFINDCTISDLCLNAPSLAILNTSNGAISSANFKDYKPADNTPAGSLYDESFWNTGVHSDGTKVCVGLYSRVNLWYGKENKTRYNQYSGGNDFCIIAEYVHDGILYYSPMPCLSSYNTQRMFVKESSQKAFPQTTDNFPVEANYNFIIDFIINEDDFIYSMHSPVYYPGEFEMSDFTDFYVNFSGGNYNMKPYTAYGLNIGITRYSGGVSSSVLAYPTVSPLQIMQALAATCIPFRLEGGFDSIPNTFDDTFYIGVKNSDLQATCTWVQGEAVKDNIPDEYIPEDFEPYDPFFDPDADEKDTGEIPLGDVSIFSPTQAFIKHYVMGWDNLSVLGAVLWGGLQGFDPGTLNMIDNFYLTKMTDIGNYALDFTLSNVIDYFVALRWYPLDLLHMNLSAVLLDEITVGTASKPIQATGTYKLPIGWEVTTANKVVCPNQNLITLSGGYVDIPAAQSFLDNEPNVSASIYVPYCGTVDVQPSQIRGSRLDIEYCVDIASGALTAFVMKNKDVRFPIAVLEGNCGFEIPMSGNNFNTQYINAMLSGAKTKTGALSSLIGSGGRVAGQLAVKDFGGALSTIGNEALSQATTAANLALSYPQMMGTSPIATGSAAAMTALRSPQKAFVQFVQHSGKPAANYGRTFGKVANVYGKLKEQSGLVICKNPDLTGIPATQAELNEIYNLLTSGVYI